MVVFFIVSLWLPLQKSDFACSGLLLKGSSSSTLPPSGCSQGFFSNSVLTLPYSMMNSEMAVSVNSCYKNKVNWQQVNNMTEGWLALLLEIAWGVESFAKGKKKTPSPLHRKATWDGLGIWLRCPLGTSWVGCCRHVPLCGSPMADPWHAGEITSLNWPGWI